MKAAERARQRWNGTSAPPDRYPDFELQGWIEKGHVDWVRLLWYSDPVASYRHHEQVAMLIDAAWVHAAGAADIEDKERPAVWITLDRNGRLAWMHSQDLAKGTGLPHAWWLLKYWARMSPKWWRLAWRVARGRG